MSGTASTMSSRPPKWTYYCRTGTGCPWAAVFTLSTSRAIAPVSWPSFLPGRKNVLFAADAADNLFGLSYSCFYENFTEAEHSLERLATFDFDIACFGHGRSVMRRASEKFRSKFLAHKHKGPAAKTTSPYLVVEQDAIVRIQEPEEKI